MKTLTALFDNYADAATAVRALEDAGFASSDIAMVVSTYDDAVDQPPPNDDGVSAEGAGTGAGIGALLGGAGGLLAGLGALAIPGIGPVVAAGWLVTTALGAVAGAAVGGATGSIIAGLTGSGIHEADAHVLAEGVRRGGSVVSVRSDESRQDAVQSIFAAAHQVDIAERRARYETEGWQFFDPDAAPYEPDDIRRRRGLDNQPGPL